MRLWRLLPAVGFLELHFLMELFKLQAQAVCLQFQAQKSSTSLHVLSLANYILGNATCYSYMDI